MAIVFLDHNHLIEINFAEDHQIDETHKIIHKIDIADETAEIISIETITQDKTPTEVIIQTIVGTVFFRTIGKNTIPMTVQEKHSKSKLYRKSK